MQWGGSLPLDGFVAGRVLVDIDKNGFHWYFWDGFHHFWFQWLCLPKLFWFNCFSTNSFWFLALSGWDKDHPSRTVSSKKCAWTYFIPNHLKRDVDSLFERPTQTQHIGRYRHLIQGFRYSWMDLRNWFRIMWSSRPKPGWGESVVLFPLCLAVWSRSILIGMDMDLVGERSCAVK